MSSIEITQHAIDRYEKVCLAIDRRSVSDGDACSEIRELFRAGTPAAAPWQVATPERPTDDTRRYLAFGQARALVLELQDGSDGLNVTVVLSVITQPTVGVDCSET